MQSWEALYEGGKVKPWHFVPVVTARDIGDARDLPKLHDMLRGLWPPNSNDIVMLTNDDNILSKELPNVLAERVPTQRAVCSFRVNLPSGKPDYGRDLFAFTLGWLHHHLPIIPDMWLGEFEWDLILTIIMRKYLGMPIERTSDFHTHTKAELPLGLVLHEQHDPMWMRAEMKEAPAKVWNRLHAREWYSQNNLKHLCTV